MAKKAKVTRPLPRRAKTRATASRGKVPPYEMDPRDTPRREPPPRVVAEDKHPIDTAVDRFFTNETRVREAMTRNLKERGAATMEVASRAKAAFEHFSPSKYSAEDRKRRNYVPEGECSAAATRAVVEKGVVAMREASPRRSIKIYSGGGLDDLIDTNSDGAGVVSLDALMSYVGAKINSGPVTAAASKAFTECRAELEAQRRLDEILGDGEDQDDPAVDDADDGTDIDGTEPLEADALVSEQVRTQMKTATSPEEKVLFAVPSRASPKQTEKAIETFELRAGPADVTSYHDFNNLQIAFEHVWSEIFDGRISVLGENLYHEYVKLQQFIGVDPANRRIDTIDDLKALMAEIRELAKFTNDATPAQLQPKDPQGTSSTTPTNSTNAVVDVVQTVLDPASVITNSIGDETVAAILNPGGALIGAIADLIRGTPQLTWASFPGPLPGNADMISTAFQPNASPAGTVEIELRTGQNTAGWKGLTFLEYDSAGAVINRFDISNVPNDPHTWDPASYNVLPLYTPQVASAVLEFHHEGMFGVHTRCFVMSGLAEKLKDRTRVTFTWTKDR